MPRYTLSVNSPGVQRELRGAAVRGLFLSGEFVLGETQAVVPIDETALSRSGTSSVDEQQLVAAVSYDTPYAAVQHEQMDYQHAPGRQAKYLEQPLNASRRTIEALVAAQLRRAMR